MSEELLDYSVALVGGPYDGVTDLMIVGDPNPPDAVWAFTCRGEWCGGAFRINGRHHVHTYLAFPEADRPPHALEYVLAECGGNTSGEFEAVYKRGDFRPLGREQERELVGAGMSGDLGTRVHSLEEYERIFGPTPELRHVNCRCTLVPA